MAEYAYVQPESLIPVPEELTPEIAVFTEPAASTINALAKIGLQKKQNLLIVGGGTCGLIAAAAAAESTSCSVTVLEKQQHKAMKAARPAKDGGFRIVTRLRENEMFDAALNACSSSEAFSTALNHTKTAGTIAFYSGLEKNIPIPAHLLNEIHYRQLTIHGAYGCTKKQMRKALCLIKSKPDFFHSVTEKFINIEETPKILKKVLSGNFYRFIIRFKH
jgi:threonine dehydrogenase-like Zn-dependent dehydrogenase